MISIISIYLFSIVHSVNPSLSLGVAKTESDLETHVMGDRGKSYGLFQIKCATAKDLGLKLPCKSLLFSPINAYYGIAYLKLKTSKHGLKKGISAYNAGRPFICKKNCKGKQFRNQRYVNKVLLLANL